MGNKELVDKWFNEALINENLDILDKIVHPKYTDGDQHEGPTGPEYVRKKFAGVNKALSDKEAELVELIEEDDKIACRYKLNGTVIDSFMGIEASGNTLTQNGVTIFTFKDDKIFKTWGVYDRKEMIDQLTK